MQQETEYTTCHNRNTYDGEIMLNHVSFKAGLPYLQSPAAMKSTCMLRKGHCRLIEDIETQYWKQFNSKSNHLN